MEISDTEQPDGCSGMASGAAASSSSSSGLASTSSGMASGAAASSSSSWLASPSSSIGKLSHVHFAVYVT